MKKKKKKKKQDKTFGNKNCVCEFTQSVEYLDKMKTKNKMVLMGIEPGTRDSQANALTVTPRHLHVELVVFTVFRPSHCLIAQLSYTCFLRVDNH